MRQAYIAEYKRDLMLRASLELLKSYALFDTPAITSRSHFIVVFLRLADRCLYHSVNGWSHLIDDLNVPADMLGELETDAVMETNDVVSKYEIEAYLSATKSLFEKNFIGIEEAGKQNILGNSFPDSSLTLESLIALFQNGKDHFFPLANKIRNHSCHVNRQLRDAGFTAKIIRAGTLFKVSLPNMYEDNNGDAIDLADVFVESHRHIVALVAETRDLLLAYLEGRHQSPSHNTYLPIESAHGNMMVGLGPAGFEFKDFGESLEHELNKPNPADARTSRG